MVTIPHAAITVVIQKPMTNLEAYSSYNTARGNHSCNTSSKFNLKDKIDSYSYNTARGNHSCNVNRILSEAGIEVKLQYRTRQSQL